MLREFAALAAGNLWRMKLRSALTAAGVVVGIGALVAMLSFAFGVQRNVARQFREIGLFETLHVLPAAEGDTLRLNDEALERIAALPGVALVYPQETFDAQLEWPGHEHAVTAQALPARFAEKRNPGPLAAGRFFARDDAAEVVLHTRLLEALELPADSLLGRRVTLRTAGVGQLAAGLILGLLRDRELPPELWRLASEAATASAALLGRDRIELTVCGVAELQSGFGFRVQDVLVPSETARRLDRLSFSDPFDLLARLNNLGRSGHALAVVTLENAGASERVRGEIEAMGLRVISFADQFGEMRRGFLVFDLIVGVLGFIALFVAALGIANTMAMSIVERTREIGVMKSLGAEDGHIRGLFLVESGLLGLLGSLGGVALGWLVSRIGDLVVRRVFAAQELPPIGLFHLPALLALGAVCFGVLVSLLAGGYPAARAARVDPVEALRRD